MRTPARVIARACASLLLFTVASSCTDASKQTNASTSQGLTTRGPHVFANAHHDTSPPLRTLVAAEAPARLDEREEEDRPAPLHGEAAPRVNDPVRQSAVVAAVAPALLTNIEGLGAGMPTGSYNYPSDTVSAVGDTQVVELVNTSIAVFDKTSDALVYGPKPTNTIWSGFGGPCETSNDGDAKVRYDALANRWVVSQFSYFTAPYGVCYAVSATSDATGSWHRYFFSFQSQTDSPMLAVWPDAYYVTINGVLTADNLDVPVCALDRAKMLTGAAATQQCFSTGARGSEPVPSDLDGTTLPPTGAPNVVVNIDYTGTSQLHPWKVHVDWTTPANSTITALAAIPVAAYALPTAPVPQPGTTTTITPNGDPYRLAYRNFGDHESLVFAHETTSGSVGGARWYELRMSAGAPTVYQQGTFAPADNVWRFLPSVAMDHVGNIAVGYSVGNATVSPGIRFTGRLATDPLGQMTQGEGTIVDGAGAQTGTSRWGDYASMSVDPVDDCTFWFTTQYIGEVTSTGWRSRLASFRLPGCATTPPSNPITNGDFETGSLTGWTTSGTASVGGSAHGGSYAAIVGSTGATNGDSSIAQTFTAPASGGTLSFFYDVHCTDTVTYDWATATLTDNTAGTTQTVLANTCTNTNTWNQVSSTLVGGHSYTLTLLNHDDNNPGDPTYTKYDDVTVTATTPPPPQTLTNGTFETGSLSPWTSSGTTSVTTSNVHGGTYAAMCGATGATSGDSSIAQTFTAPSTGGTLTFWYRVTCPDTVTYDWATATLKDNTAGTSTTPLAKTCTNTGAWVQVTVTLVANHSYTLTLTSHDDGYAGDPTYTLFDDVSVN